MNIKKFCHDCGGPLVDRDVDGRVRRFCTSCNAPVYENPIPASAVVVMDDAGRVLFVKRSVEPKAGWWCLPGGFMELGETPEECALRELVEETGLSGRISDTLGVTANKSAQYHTVLMMGFLVEQYTGDLIAGDDADDAVFFAPDSLPDIAFDSHRRFVRVALAERGSTRRLAAK
ncbi:MAG: NUDIX domain-containing protein [Desulfatibacillaceae bacterium]